jgi:hypothetical protein
MTCSGSGVRSHAVPSGEPLPGSFRRVYRSADNVHYVKLSRRQGAFPGGAVARDKPVATSLVISGYWPTWKRSRSSSPRSGLRAGMSAGLCGQATRFAVRPVPGRRLCTRCSPTWRTRGSRAPRGLSGLMSRAGRSSLSWRARPPEAAGPGLPGFTPRTPLTRSPAGCAPTTRPSPTSSRRPAPSGAAAAPGHRS